MPRNKDAEQMADYRFEGRGLGLRHGQRPVSVNLPEDLDRYVRAKENRSAWMRDAIVAAALAEGWRPDEPPSAS